MRGKRENFFSREKKFSLSPRAPHSLSRKAENFLNYILPAESREYRIINNGDNDNGQIENK